MIQTVSRTLTFALLVATYGTLPTSGQGKVFVGLRLYRKIAEANRGKNVIYSPMAVSQAMRMVYLGSDGATKAQIEAAMQLSEREKNDSASSYFASAEHDTMENLVPLSGRYSLLMANRLYATSKSTYKESYKQLIVDDYGDEPETENFRGDSLQARRSINAWVNITTEYAIPEFFPLGRVYSSNKLVLVSAFAFRATWMKAFDVQETSRQTFHLSSGANITVPMLRCGPNEEMGYANNTASGFEVLKLFFRGHRENMFFVLPHRNQTLAAVESLLETNRELELVTRTNPAFLKMSIPKFRFEQVHNLKQRLRDIGIVDAFDDAKANFSKLFTNSTGLKLTKVTHKTILASDEQGTGLTTRADSKCLKTKSDKEPIDFVIDRPFLFLVLDVTTGTVIFRGRILNPLETKGRWKDRK